MKVILVGYQGSRKVRAASQYLVKKYLPFETTWLEYTGAIEGWSAFVADYLRGLTDTHVIFALDDYLLASPLDSDRFNMLLSYMDEDVVCARLCDSSFYKNTDITGELIRVGVDDYTCTTQYCIWDREALINILEQVHTPWEFELEGSEFMNRISYSVIGTATPALQYNTNSSLSNRWEGVDLAGLSEEDIKEVQKLL